MPKAKASNKKRQRPSAKNGTTQIRPVWLICWVGTLGAIVVSGLGVVESAAQARSLYQTLGEIQRQHDQLLEEHSRLSIERSTMSSLQKIESTALQELDMEFPSAISMVSDG